MNLTDATKDTINPPPKMLLTAKQASQALAICERTLFELTKRGDIARLKIGASVRYDVRDIEAFIAKNKSDATP